MASSIAGRPEEVDAIIHVHPRTYLVRDAAMVAVWLALAVAFLMQVSTPGGIQAPASMIPQADSYAMASPQVPCAVDASK